MTKKMHCTDKPDLFTSDLVTDAGYEANRAAFSDAPTREPDLFADATRAAEEEARQVCLGCPLLMQCLRDSLVTPSDAVQGATTAAERVQIRDLLDIAHPMDDLSAAHLPIEDDQFAAVKAVLEGRKMHTEIVDETGLSFRHIARISSTTRDLRAGDDATTVQAKHRLDMATVKVIESMLTGTYRTSVTSVTDDDLAQAAAAVLTPHAHTPAPAPTHVGTVTVDAGTLTAV